MSSDDQSGRKWVSSVDLCVDDLSGGKPGWWCRVFSLMEFIANFFCISGSFWGVECWWEGDKILIEAFMDFLTL